MKTFNALLFIILVGLVGCTTGSAQDINREFSTSTGKSLNLNSKSGGSISVEGWDQNLIKVEVTGV
ncbi:MAG: hypothetical protein HC880_16530 [Bacteroidia bacterium]|nr:hypothetical protein [Bacteroidia bacterium]